MTGKRLSAAGHRGGGGGNGIVAVGETDGLAAGETGTVAVGGASGALGCGTGGCAVGPCLSGRGTSGGVWETTMPQAFIGTGGRCDEAAAETWDEKPWERIEERIEAPSAGGLPGSAAATS